MQPLGFPVPAQFPVPEFVRRCFPPSVLEPDPHLAALLDGIGVETCGELAALEGESVEVRLGAEGVRLWKLARGDDDRLIFAPIPRALPHASLEWSDYALTDTERLLFSVNALLGTVCEKLMERGSLAREMTLDARAGEWHHARDPGSRRPRDGEPQDVAASRARDPGADGACRRASSA